MRPGLRKLVARLHRLIVRVEGQDLVEYALVISLISVAAIASSVKVANAINALFSAINASIT